MNLQIHPINSNLLSMAQNYIEQYCFAMTAILLIVGAVSAVHHTEVVAHKKVEPYGALVLAISVTIIEVYLIFSMMIAGHESSEFISRDAVFATVMIMINGVIGLCIFIGGVHHHEMVSHNQGTNSALAVLRALATFILVMPIVTTSTPGPDFTKSQLHSYFFKLSVIGTITYLKRKRKKRISIFMRLSRVI